MSQVITNAFEQYWQSCLTTEQPVVMDEFILADIPNLDITSPIDPDAGLPPESQIVHRQNVDQRGRINNNAVAYTIVMDTTVGDFSFNAMYLRNKQNGVIGMIVYKGRETKLKTDQNTGQTGNSLVKSMLMGYDQAAEATLTHVDAGTWQIDYAARLRGMDEDIRQLQADLYGHHTFVGDGFKVVEKDGAYQVSQGVAIIGGLRVELNAPEVIHPGTKPIGVWVDAYRAGSLLSEHQNHFTIITSVADLTDHVDSNGYQHYVAKLGSILADSTIEDVRGDSAGGSSGAIQDTFALWIRSMAEAGLDLIGKFGSEHVIENKKQVLLDEKKGEVYSWGGQLPKFVDKDELPENKSDWQQKNLETLRGQLSKDNGVDLVVGAAKHVDVEYLKTQDYIMFDDCSVLKGMINDGIKIKGEMHGDSTFAGSVSGNASEIEKENPAVVLRSTLYAVYGENAPEIVDKTMPGRSLKSMIYGLDGYRETFDDVMKKSDSKIVYCNHAQNDCNSFGSDTAEFTENLKLFVNTCRKYGKVPVLVTPNTTFVSGGITEKANVRLPSFVDAIRSVAKTMKVDLVDNYYFFKKTLRSVKASDLTPDGVHPSKKGYAMVGRNLAMPLLSYGSLRDDFDGFGISNVNYSDTFSNERFLQVSDSRYGNTIICRSDDSDQKINIPVVLDNPTDRTVIGINCLSWIDGGFVMATHDNSIQSEEFSGMMDQSNGIAVDYRSVISPDVCNLYAGLHLVGIYTGMGLVSDTGKMSFSGVTLLPRNVSCVGESFPQARRSRDFKRSIMAGDTIEFRCNVLADDMCFLEIAPVVGSTSPWLSIKKIGGNVIVDLWGGQTTVLNEISIGMHNFTVKVNHDRSISIKIDNLVDVTTSKALTGHPLSFILGENLSNEISYFVSR